MILRLSWRHQIYEEKASGKQADRPELAHCLKALGAGDTLVVWHLDRLGRSLPDLVRIISELEAHGMAFESVTEKRDQQRAQQASVSVFPARAELESSIRERTAPGIALNNLLALFFVYDMFGNHVDLHYSRRFLSHTLLALSRAAHLLASVQRD